MFAGVWLQIQACFTSCLQTPNRAYCCMPTCTNRKSKCPAVSFHMFPRVQPRHYQWIVTIKWEEGEHFLITENPVVCCEHFVDSNFYFLSDLDSLFSRWSCSFLEMPEALPFNMIGFSSRVLLHVPSDTFSACQPSTECSEPLHNHCISLPLSATTQELDSLGLCPYTQIIIVELVCFCTPCWLPHSKLATKWMSDGRPISAVILFISSFSFPFVYSVAFVMSDIFFPLWHTKTHTGLSWLHAGKFMGKLLKNCRGTVAMLTVPRAQVEEATTDKTCSEYHHFPHM